MRRGPSWKQLVIVLGVIATAVVVVSPALGGPSVKSQDNVDRAKQPAHSAKKKKKPKPVVGPQGPAGAAGVAGTTGAAGSARAFAAVQFAGPSFQTGKVQGFTAVTRPGTGVYCLTAPGIDSSTTVPVASVDFGMSSTANSFAEVRQSAANCSAGQFEVDTFTPPNTPVSTVGFTLMVP
jgi:hypothetical protein